MVDFERKMLAVAANLQGDGDALAESNKFKRYADTSAQVDTLTDGRTLGLADVLNHIYLSGVGLYLIIVTPVKKNYEDGLKYFGCGNSTAKKSAWGRLSSEFVGQGHWRIIRARSTWSDWQKSFRDIMVTQIHCRHILSGTAAKANTGTLWQVRDCRHDTDFAACSRKRTNLRSFVALGAQVTSDQRRIERSTHDLRVVRCVSIQRKAPKILKP